MEASNVFYQKAKVMPSAENTSLHIGFLERLDSSGVYEQMVKSYGGMTVTMRFLPAIEQLRMQGLNKWWYNRGVSRVQTLLVLCCLEAVYYFVD